MFLHAAAAAAADDDDAATLLLLLLLLAISPHTSYQRIKHCGSAAALKVTQKRAKPSNT
jgi:hypothetical protein